MDTEMEKGECPTEHPGTPPAAARGPPVDVDCRWKVVEGAVGDVVTWSLDALPPDVVWMERPDGEGEADRPCPCEVTVLFNDGAHWVNSVMVLSQARNVEVYTGMTDSASAVEYRGMGRGGAVDEAPIEGIHEAFVTVEQTCRILTFRLCSFAAKPNRACLLQIAISCKAAALPAVPTAPVKSTEEQIVSGVMGALMGKGGADCRQEPPGLMAMLQTLGQGGSGAGQGMTDGGGRDAMSALMKSLSGMAPAGRAHVAPPDFQGPGASAMLAHLAAKAQPTRPPVVDSNPSARVNPPTSPSMVASRDNSVKDVDIVSLRARWEGAQQEMLVDDATGTFPLALIMAPRNGDARSIYNAILALLPCGATGSRAEFTVFVGDKADLSSAVLDSDMMTVQDVVSLCQATPGATGPQGLPLLTMRPRAQYATLRGMGAGGRPSARGMDQER